LYVRGSQAKAELLKESFGNLSIKVIGQKGNIVLSRLFNEQMAK